jgi:iron(III) transport system permease protein
LSREFAQTAAFRRRDPLWVALIAALCALAPVISLAIVALRDGGAGGRWIATLGPAFSETSQLLGGVLLLTSLVGVGCGWLVARFEFPGRGILAFALVLPFATPTYIAAYCYIDFLDFFGPVQTALRKLLGVSLAREYWFPGFRNMGGAVVIVGLVLYPYVYLATRAALTLQGSSLVDTARSLGRGEGAAFLAVALPVIWPALAAALSLVAFETLNDIGAVQYLGVNTLTAAIYATWLNRGGLGDAAVIALSALALVIGLISLERMVRRQRRFQLTARPARPMGRVRLTGAPAWLASLACALPVALGFGIPFFVLFSAVVADGVGASLSATFLRAALNSLLIATATTLLVMSIAALAALAGRFSRSALTPPALRVAAFGYALPGTVLVLGLMPVLGGFDELVNRASLALGGPRLGLILGSSVGAVVLACLIRFLAVGLEQTQAALGAISPNTDHAAATLGCGRLRHARDVLLPTILPALAGAALLVFVDTLKELPATLLLRPLNFETLATTLYGDASRGSFEDGAMAGLLIMLAGLAPLVLVNRMIERRPEGVRRSARS